MIIDEFEDAIGEWNRADLPALRKPEQLAIAAEQLHMSPDLDLAGVEVDVVEREPEYLALPQTEACAEVDNELEPIRQLIADGHRLLSRPRPQLPRV